MNRDEYVDLMKSTALDLGGRFVMQFLIEKIPFLALPVINPIVGFIVNFILSTAIKQTEMGAFFLYIDTRTNKQGIAFMDAAVKNRLAQQSGTAEAKANAEQELIDSFRSFVKFTN